MADVKALPEVGESAPELRPAPPVDLGRASKLGLAGAVVMVLVAAVGIVGRFQAQLVIDPFLPLGLTFLYLAPLAFGWIAARPARTLEGFAEAVPGGRNVLAGTIVGAVAGLGIVFLVLVMSAVNLRGVFIELSPALADILLFGRDTAVGILLILFVSTLAGTAGAAIHLIPRRARHAVMPALMWVLIFALLRDVVGQLFTGIRLEALNRLVYTRRGGPLTAVGAVGVFLVFLSLYWYVAGRPTSLRQRFAVMPRKEKTRWTVVLAVLILLVVWVTPQIMGPFVSQVLDTAGIFLLMALGLNIVVGYAGLLDLGYVAFFAVGAYAAAIFTSPLSPVFQPELNLVVALPLIMVAAAVAGVMVATPVIRMRGDYLAIVTLGFGEIARILFNSQWLSPYVGGAQGITNIPNVTIGPITFRSPEDYFYPIFFFVLVAAYITYAVEKSRWGRAWMAMREDELVAEAMGVNIVTAKLSAFVVGAVLASFGGALFAAQIGSVFPHSFDIVVSITVLVIIIVGGMGSVPGVTVGALILIGLPNLLREFSEYQFLFYGVLLIAMMLNKPEGFIPSKRRAAELHQEELSQDDWMEIYGVEAAETDFASGEAKT